MFETRFGVGLKCSRHALESRSEVFETRFGRALSHVEKRARMVLRCLSNVDTQALDTYTFYQALLAWLAADYPLRQDFETIEAPAGYKCLVAQVFPRRFEFVSTCLHYVWPDTGLEDTALVGFNMLARTCNNADECNRDCLDVGSWSYGRKINMGLFMIIVALGIVLLGTTILTIANFFDRRSTEAKVSPTSTRPSVKVVSKSRSGPKEEGGKSGAQASFRQVFSVVGGMEFAIFLFGCFCMAVTGMAIPFMSWNFGRSIGNLAGTDPYGTMSNLCLVLVYLAAGQLVTASIGYACLEPTSVRIAQLWREKYLKAVLRQDIGWFDVNRGGGVLSKMSEDTAYIQRGTGIQIGLFLMNLVSTVGALILAFSWAGYWNIALVCLAVVPFLVLSSALMLATNDRMSKLETKAFEAAGAISSEAITSMRTVQAINAQKDFLSRFREALIPAERASLIKVVANGCSIGGINASFMLMYLVAGIYIAYIVSTKYDETNCNLRGLEGLIRVISNGTQGNEDYPECQSTGRDGDTYIGDILATLFNIAFAGMGLGQIGEPLQKVVAARTAVYKILGVVSRIPVIDSASDEGLKPEDIGDEIQLNDVVFAYPTRPDSLVAKGLSLTIKAGETVALVGPSGSGKSTVMALVQRYYDPVSGIVSLGGYDLKTLNVKFLRSMIGLVGQEPVLFAGTFMENIMYGAPDHETSKEAVIDAAKRANAHNFIMKLEKGYDTNVGAGGSKISGGQKQRIAIARAIVRNPAVLLLDEATSALDNESEKIVQEALNDLTANQGSVKMTTIVIAHRLSTIVNSDTIHVIKDGELHESGKHSELLSKGGLYSLLWKKQGIQNEGAASGISSLFAKSNTTAKEEEIEEVVADIKKDDNETEEGPEDAKKRLKAEAKNRAPNHEISA